MEPKDDLHDPVAHVLGIIANGGTPEEIAHALRVELEAAYERGVVSTMEEYDRHDCKSAVEKRVKSKAAVFAALYIANAREAFKPTGMAADDHAKEMVDTLIANGALAEAEALLTRPAK